MVTTVNQQPRYRLAQNPGSACDEYVHCCGYEGFSSSGMRGYYIRRYVPTLSSRTGWKFVAFTGVASGPSGARRGPARNAGITVGGGRGDCVSFGEATA